MDSSTDNARKEGDVELTPAVIESATQEILQNANDILQMYGIEGAVTSIKLGLIPVHGKLSKPDEQGYELSFSQHQDFSIVVKYSLPEHK